MTELSPEAAALLEAARQNHGPTEHDRQRVLSTLHRSLGIGLPAALTAAGLSTGQGAAASSGASLAGSQAAASLPLAGATTSGASSLAGATHVAAHAAPTAAQGGLGLFSKLLTWKAGKLLLAGVAMSSAVGIGSVVVQRTLPDAAELPSKAGSAAAFATASADAGSSSAPAPTAAAERQPAAVAAANEPADRVALPAQAIDDEVPPTLLAATPAVEPAHAAPDVQLPRGTTRGHHRHGKRVSVRSVTGVPAARQPASAADEALAAPAETESIEQPASASVPEAPQELTLIRRALTSLRDGEPARALVQLDDHAARFPSGSFSTERRGLRVVALCAAGRTGEGERERAAFLKHSGSSPIAARVRSACTGHDD